MMNRKKSNYLVMIVGMHRSGTSAVGKLLQNMGFEFGSNLLEGINTINDEGFWEDKEVVALNEHIFELYDFDWFDFERMPGKWWEDDQIKDLVGVAETWYYESFSGDVPIAVKDPRLCRLLPFWKRVFQGLDINLHVLFVYRHPVEVAASLKKRDNFPLQLGYLLWLSYTIDALYYSRNLNLSLLNYEELLDAPDKTIDRLLDKDLPDTALFSQLNRSSLAEKSLDLTRYHQKAENLLSDSLSQGDIQGLAIELYEELLTASADTAKGLADKYRKRLYRLLDHHKEILSALREETHSQVMNVQKLFKLGGDHAHALAVIREKDTQLEENKGFITRCLAEIENKDSLLRDSNESSQINSASVEKNYAQKFENWMSDLNKLVDDYRSRIEEQKKYITECDEKIAFQEKGLADNQDYIARCHSRIAEQDVGIAENRGYIAACEERIRAQDEGLSIRDKTLDEKDSRILDLEKNLLLLKESVDFMEKNLSEKEERNSHLKEKVSSLHSEIQQQEASVLQYRSQLGVSEEKLSESMLQVGFFEKSLFELQEKLNNSLERVRVTEDNFGKSLIQIEELNKISRDQQQQLEEYAEKVRADEKALSESQARIEELSGISRNQQQELEKYAERARADEQALSTSRVRIEELNKNLLSQQQQLGECAEKLRIGEEGLKESQAHIATLDAAVLELKGLVSERDHTLRENKSLIEDQASRLGATEIFLTEKTALLDLANQKLSEYLAEINRLQGLDGINHQRLALQKIQLEKLKAHGAALESELVALQAEHEEWGRQLERYRSYRMVKAIDKLFPET